MNIVATFEGPTGQVGTLGALVVAPTSTGPVILLPRTTGPIIEIGTTGIYFLQAEVPDTEHFIVVWDLLGEYAGEGFTVNFGSATMVSSYQGDTALVGQLQIQVVNADAGASTLLAPTVAGVFEIGVSGVYYWAGQLGPAQHKIAIWTIAGTQAAEEIIGPPTAISQFPVLSGIDGASLAEFWLKRNDTLDTLAIVCEDDAGAPKNLVGASAMFNMAPRGLPSNTFTGPPTIHKPAFIADAPNGIVAYLWDPSDTVLEGTYAAEFEVHFGDGSVQTFPNTTYITVHIVPDVDPGL